MLLVHEIVLFVSLGFSIDMLHLVGYIGNILCRQLVTFFGWYVNWVVILLEGNDDMPLKGANLLTDDC